MYQGLVNDELAFCHHFTPSRLLSKIQRLKPGIVAHTCSPRIQKAEVGRIMDLRPGWANPVSRKPWLGRYSSVEDCVKNRSEARDSMPGTTKSDTYKYMKTLLDSPLSLPGLSSDPAVFLSVVPSDDEKGRQMWRKYLEREDSRIGGK